MRASPRASYGGRDWERLSSWRGGKAMMRPRTKKILLAVVLGAAARAEHPARHSSIPTASHTNRYGDSTGSLLVRPVGLVTPYDFRRTER